MGELWGGGGERKFYAPPCTFLNGTAFKTIVILFSVLFQHNVSQSDVPGVCWTSYFYFVHLKIFFIIMRCIGNGHAVFLNMQNCFFGFR